MSRPSYLTAAFYLFVDLPDYTARKQPLLDFCEQRHVKGMILLAREGINSTIAGAAEDVRAVLAYLRDPLGYVTSAFQQQVRGGQSCFTLPCKPSCITDNYSNSKNGKPLFGVCLFLSLMLI